jgi:hypothetical protein
MTARRVVVEDGPMQFLRMIDLPDCSPKWNAASMSRERNFQ